jgi:hypothetical protein
VTWTTRADRAPIPKTLANSPALAALIFCAGKHPDKRLGELVENAMRNGQFSASDAELADALRYVSDEELAAALHAYAKEA